MMQSQDMAKLEQWQIEDAARLKSIFSTSDQTQETFGALFEIGNQAMVGQYLNAKRPLNLKAVGNFARGLKTTVDEISPTLANQIRELNAVVKHEGKYSPESAEGEIAARIVDKMASKPQREKAIKIVNTLAEPEDNGGETPMSAAQ